MDLGVFFLLRINPVRISGSTVKSLYLEAENARLLLGRVIKRCEAVFFALASVVYDACFMVSGRNRNHKIAHIALARDVLGSIAGPAKSNTASPTARHRYNASLELC